MKKFARTITLFLAATILSISSGCFGEFALIRKLYTWNDNVVDSKIVKTLIFYVLTILPVYSIAGFIDVVILNLIEFWSGSNPMSMGPDEYEYQDLALDGKNYRIEATQNQFTITRLDGEPFVQKLRYDVESTTWMVSENGQAEMALIGMVEENGVQSVAVYNQSGEIASFVDPKELQLMSLTAMN